MSRKVMLGLLTAAATALNPGALFQLDKNSLNPLKTSLIPMINQKVKHIAVDKSFASSVFVVSNVQVEVAEIRDEQIALDFDADPHSIGVTAHDIVFDFAFDIEIVKFIRARGRGKGTAGIKRIAMRAGFAPFRQENPRPFITFGVGEFELDAHRFRLELSFDHIPDFIVDMIIKAFRSTIIREITAKVLSQAQLAVEKAVNEKIDKNFPLDVVMPHDLALSVRLTDAPLFDDQFLLLPLDGVFFRPSQGYSRDMDPWPISVHRADPRLLTFYLSEATLFYLHRSLAQREVQTTCLGFACSFVVLPSPQPFVLTEGALQLSRFGVDFSIQLGSVSVRLKMALDADLRFESFDPESLRLAFRVRHVAFPQFGYETNFPVLNRLIAFLPVVAQWYFSFVSRIHLTLPKEMLPFGLKLKGLDWHECDASLRLAVDVDV